MDSSIWMGVRERVLALIAAPAGDRVFGATGHKFLLEDPLTPAGLADLESQTGVSLPGEYRDFLLHVGAGGAGPSYGVYPVRLVQGRWRWEGDGAELADLSRLAEPFPREGADPEAVQLLLSERPEEETSSEGCGPGRAESGGAPRLRRQGSPDA
ncbi:SMI1/KNR4 family protein [Streptomyces sp. bgisy091]|uniref:SMI1/KNR4 family protein n=1 Tax=Streptomyces sp. bgisy091 TaxID=3413778 RepID=UPI003D744EB0